MIAFSSAQANPSPFSEENGSLFLGSATDFAADARQRLAEAEEILKTVVTNEPVLAVGAALAVGVILGWLIKRR